VFPRSNGTRDRFLVVVLGSAAQLWGIQKLDAYMSWVWDGIRCHEYCDLFFVCVLFRTVVSFVSFSGLGESYNGSVGKVISNQCTLLCDSTTTLYSHTWHEYVAQGHLSFVNITSDTGTIRWPPQPG
jgi:hypothetical protein